MGGKPKLIWCGLSTRRRDICRAAVVFAVTALAICASGCGGGDNAATDSEKAADVEVVNAAMAQELTAIDAYSRVAQNALTPLHAPVTVFAKRVRSRPIRSSMTSFLPFGKSSATDSKHRLTTASSPLLLQTCIHCYYHGTTF